MLDFATHVRPAMHYPSVADADAKTLFALHSASPPVTAFVDSSGHIVKTVHGALSSVVELQHDITTYLHVTT
jgi:hypothetical protein